LLCAIAITLHPLSSMKLHVQMLIRDAGALLQLRPLGDRCVVRLMECGTLMGEQYVVIATHLVPGTHHHLMAATPTIKQEPVEAVARCAGCRDRPWGHALGEHPRR
jgi:hypothetical protein